MQIIIPMSGFGERFRSAGYRMPKPLINIDGKPIIAHVIDMFPGENNFIFICNQDHLDTEEFQMEAIINRYCASGCIVGIPSHKLGPIHAVRQALHLIDQDSPVVINYCDFTCYWDWNNFKEYVARLECQGAIPAYKGFHPHSLGNTNYAYMREADGWVEDIQEKQPYTNNRMEEYASSGTYYFASGKIMSEAFSLTIEQDLSINGEFYVSLAYKALLAKNMTVAIYPLQHFMQWGTPEDVDQYNTWSNIFRNLIIPTTIKNNPESAVIIPMAGLGKRFADEGYDLTKPLIPVSGRPMFAQATHDLPESDHHAFVLRSDMQGCDEVSMEIKRLYPNSVIKLINNVTEGQACTALIGLDALESKLGRYNCPVTIGACDNGALYNSTHFNDLVEDPEVDVIVWGIRGYPNAARNPNMYGWIEEKNGLISYISVKTPITNPFLDPVVIGTFTFQRSDDFRRCVERLIQRDGRINGEFYIDSCINDAIELGMRCRLFEIDNYLCWGTPNDLRTFEYWQSCFHKWPTHPYRLELDTHIPRDQLKHLGKRYQAILPDVSRMKKGMIKQEICLFLLVGLLTVFIDYTVYHGFLAYKLLGLNLAKGLGFLIGTVFAYFANRFWTFSHKAPSRGSFWRFLCLYGVTLGANVLVNSVALRALSEIDIDTSNSLLLTTGIRINQLNYVEIGFLLATGVSSVLNFLGMKFFIFNKKSNKIE